MTVQLDVALSLSGAGDAVDLLFEFAGSFERPVPVERVRNTAAENETGDFGVAWSWTEGSDPDVVAFVRHNILVMLQGHHAEQRLAAAAQQIDTALRGLKTATAYREVDNGFFTEVRRTRGSAPRVPARGRLELGTPAVSTQRYFFLTNTGSVNRDPDHTDAWYYRAGTQKGRQEIMLFRLGAGILPIIERLDVDVE